MTFCSMQEYRALHSSIRELKAFNAELLKALEAYAEEFGETVYYRAVTKGKMNK